jgi:chromosome segregation ATPase
VAAIVDQFALLATAKDDAQVQEIALKERQKRERIAELANDEVAIAARKDELKEAVTKVESDIAAENATYTKNDQPLIDQLSRLNAQAAGVDAELANVSGDIGALRVRLARERDPVVRGLILSDIDRLNLLFNRLDADLVALSRRADGIKAQRAALAVRHQQAQAGFARRPARIQRIGNERKACRQRTRQARQTRHRQ